MKLVHTPTGAVIKEIVETYTVHETGLMWAMVIATEPVFPIIPSSKGGRPLLIDEARVMIADLEIQKDFEQDVLLMGGPDLTDDDNEWPGEGPAVQ